MSRITRLQNTDHCSLTLFIWERNPPFGSSFNYLFRATAEPSILIMSYHFPRPDGFLVAQKNRERECQVMKSEALHYTLNKIILHTTQFKVGITATVAFMLQKAGLLLFSISFFFFWAKKTPVPEIWILNTCGPPCFLLQTCRGPGSYDTR